MPIELVTDLKQHTLLAQCMRILSSLSAHVKSPNRMSENRPKVCREPGANTEATRFRWKTHAPSPTAWASTSRALPWCSALPPCEIFWDEAQTLALGHPETAQLVK